ncbi:MAG: SH3 domain-containing protein [Acidobacteria bacterium]|nr:SH3 domain-containing protein [Acidobacteriota bacterium]
MPWTFPKVLIVLKHGFSEDQFSRWRALLLSAGLATWLFGCQRKGPQETAELAYVSGATVEFRNELGPSSEVTGHLQSGERVRIVSRRPRWAQVLSASGQTGWVLQRYLVSQAVYDQFAILAREAEALPSQGRALIRRNANLHIEPGRNTQVFYQLAEGEQAEVVGHRVAPRSPATSEASSDAAYSTGPVELSTSNNEDWLLVRANGGRTGWLLEASADMFPPVEVAQYREGLRIRAWFEIYRELDQGEEHAWYLWATTRRLAGLPYDFDEIRVFVWNPRASRYETSYRERNLIGFYPIVVASRETADGGSPTFRLQLEDSSGHRLEKSYFMVGRQVRVER